MASEWLERLHAATRWTTPGAYWLDRHTADDKWVVCAYDGNREKVVIAEFARRVDAEYVVALDRTLGEMLAQTEAVDG